jgi:hypothetical protein
VVIVVVLKDEDTKDVPKVDMGMVTIEDMAEGEVNPPLSSTVDKLAMCQGFLPNHMCFVHTTTILNMS